MAKQKPSAQRNSFFAVLLLFLGLVVIVISSVILKRNPNQRGLHHVPHGAVFDYASLSEQLDKGVCSFIEVSLPTNKVIRTQEEFQQMLGEMQQKGYEVFALKRDSDQRGAYTNYQHLKTYSEYQNYCNSKFSVINFDQTSLLGQRTMSGGCSVEYRRNVDRDDKQKIVVYTVEVFAKGGCEKINTSYNWITVDKIPQDYRVDFKTLEIEE